MTTPARIFGIKARDAKTAVLFRRGPSKHVQLLTWNLAKDTITPGQWVKLAVYPMRSDLSPDGRHLIYFAATHKGGPASNWTAISRPPYWTALHFYGQSHAWNGGGVFFDNKRFWPDRGFGSSEVKKIASGLTEVKTAPRWIEARMGEDTVLYFPRLLRDGWTLDDTTEKPARYGSTLITRFSRPAHKGWRLCKTFTSSIEQKGPYGNVYWETHSLVKSGDEIPLNDEWAEVDQHSVIYAAKGAVYRLPVTSSGPGEAKQIANLTPNRFSSVIAPYAGLARSR